MGVCGLFSLKNDNVPGYLQLVEDIVDEIKSGKFTVGEKIPSETELCHRFTVNRYTVRQAIDKVKSLGWLETQQGKGSYVKAKPPLVCYAISGQTRFTTNMQQVGRTHQSELLHWERGVATEPEKQMLCLAVDEQIYRLEILRYVEDMPFSVTTSVLLAAAVPSFEQYLDHFKSLYQILEKHYHFTPVRVQSTFQATVADLKDTTNLKMPVDIPILKIESLMAHPAGYPVEYGVARVRGDASRCYVEF